MGNIFEKILQYGGIAGAFALLFALACWRLYRDLVRCKDARVEDAKAYEERYQNAMKETNNTLREFDRFLDRFFDWISRRG